MAPRPLETQFASPTCNFLAMVGCKPKRSQDCLNLLQKSFRIIVEILKVGQGVTEEGDEIVDQFAKNEEIC